MSSAKEMDEISWRWALATQFFGALIAVSALFSYLLLVDAQQRFQIAILPLIPSVVVFAIGLIWHLLKPQSITPACRLWLISITATINSIALFCVVSRSGGATALFTPIFLLIPHTTAIFLRETKFSWWIFVVAVLTLSTYMYAVMNAPALAVPKGNEGQYAFWVGMVLVSTVVLTTLLAWFVPCKTCSRSANQAEPTKS